MYNAGYRCPEGCAVVKAAAIGARRRAYDADTAHN